MGLFSSIGSFFSSAVSTVRDAVSSAASAVGKALSSAAQKVVAVGKKVVEKTREVFSKVGATIKKLYKEVGIGGLVGAAAGGMLGAMLGVGVATGAAIGAAAGAAAGAVVGWFKEQSYRKQKEELVQKLRSTGKDFREKVITGATKYRQQLKRFYEGEVLPVLRLLEEVEEGIKALFHRKSQISPFFLRELYRVKGQLDFTRSYGEAGKRYYHYLDRQLQRVEEKPTPYRMADLALLPIPKEGEGLPEGYLHLGKLLRVSEKELGLVNPFNQTLLLEKGEKKNLRRGEFPLLIVRFEKENRSDGPPLFKFYGSIAKGEIAERFDRGEPLIAEVAENERRGRSKHLILNYKGVQLKLPVWLKFNPHRSYHRGEQITVYPENYDYLLRQIWVRELPPEDDPLQIPVLISSFPAPVGKWKVLQYIEEREEVVLVDSRNLYRTRFSERGLVVEGVEEKRQELGRVGMEGITLFPVESELEFRELEQLIPLPVFHRFQQLLVREFSTLKEEENPLFKGAKLITQRQLKLNHYQREVIQFRREGHRLLLDNPPPALSGEWTTPPKSILFQYHKSVDIPVEDYGEFEEGVFEIRLSRTHHLNQLPEEGYGTLLISTPPYPLYKQLEAFRLFELGYLVNPQLKSILLYPHLKKPLTNPLPTLHFRNPNLTENQKRLLKGALEEMELFAIQGPPGTGKSTLIREMIYQTLSLNPESSIIVVSQQNVAVDNVLEGLLRDGVEVEMLRLGHSSKTYPSLQHLLPDPQLNRYLQQLEEELEQEHDSRLRFFRRRWLEWLKGELAGRKGFIDIDLSFKELFLRRYQLIGATCVGLANNRLGLEFLEFDLAIIDEAGRASLGELLIPILKAKKVVLIGDHKQLPPTYDRRLYQLLEEDRELEELDRRILEESYFQELYTKLPTQVKGMLKAQFRMPPPIGSLISYLFYEGQLENGRTDTPPVPIVWIDVRGREQQVGTSKLNLEEVKVIKKLVEVTDPTLSIAVITPYAAQKGALRRELREELQSRKNLKIDTIDSFQGEEADIVIYSLVRDRGNIQFLLDKRRLNVAISRTRHRLYFVGNRLFFHSKGGKLFQVILASAHLHRWPRPSRRRRKGRGRKGHR